MEKTIHPYPIAYDNYVQQKGLVFFFFLLRICKL